MAKKKAKLSPRLKREVKRAGGQSKFRSKMGYLPSDYHSNPKKYAKKLNPAQKTRIRRMHSKLRPATFLEKYGFKK